MSVFDTFFKEVIDKDLLMLKGDKSSVRDGFKTMSIIALGDSADTVEKFLNEEKNVSSRGISPRSMSCQEPLGAVDEMVWFM